MSKRTFYIIYIIYSTLIDRDAYFVFFRIVEINIHSRIRTLPALQISLFTSLYTLYASFPGPTNDIFVRY